MSCGVWDVLGEVWECGMCCGSVGCVRCVVGVWDVLGELWECGMC